jgi:hypothetical protein
MATEKSFGSTNITINTETDGRPVGNNLYKQSSTQLFRFGKRIMTFDGRVFRYGGSKTALLAGFGAANYFTVSKHVAYAVIPTAIAVGQDWADVTVAASNGYGSGGYAKDELVGGYIVVGHGASKVQNRVIIANQYMSSSGGTMRVWVDGAFETAQTVSSDGAELYPNPYKYLGKGALEYNAFMGVPAINVTSGYYAFMQTWGPCWVVPGGGDASPGDSVNDRTAYFVGDGSVNFGTSLTVETGYQLAGFCIDTTASGTSAMPLIMLQITP